MEFDHWMASPALSYRFDNAEEFEHALDIFGRHMETMAQSFDKHVAFDILTNVSSRIHKYDIELQIKERVREEL